MKEAARTSETSVDNYFTRQYIPEDNSELQILNIFAARRSNVIHCLKLSKCGMIAFVTNAK
jgi:hypothetical protein